MTRDRMLALQERLDHTSALALDAANKCLGPSSRTFDDLDAGAKLLDAAAHGADAIVWLEGSIREEGGE